VSDQGPSGGARLRVVRRPPHSDDFGMVEVKQESRYLDINLLLTHQAQHVNYLKDRRSRSKGGE
jgi:hypothetical protein